MGLLHDLRYALRLLRRNPGFATIASLTLAFGVGMLTVVFAFTNAFFLRPLPFPEPDRLVHIWQTDVPRNFDMGRVSVPNWQDWRAQSESFEDLGAYFYTSYALDIADARGAGPDADLEQIEATRMTPNLLEVLGVAPALGRAFTVDDGAPGAERVVLLSDQLWRQRLGADEAVLGASVRLDDVPHTVVGVMPSDFVFPFNAMDVWVPLDTTPWQDERASNGPLLVVGRLADGATATTAQLELDTISHRLEQTFPVDNKGKGARIVDLRSQLLFTWDIFRLVFPALFLAIGLVLAIVCANIGNLLLARAAARSREMTFRRTLGASRGRILRQLLTESLVVGLIGCGLGITLAYLLTRAAEQNMPLELYRVGAIEIDLSAFGFALGATLVATLLFGLAPALHTTRGALAASMQESGRSGAGGRRSGRLRNGLVMVQVSLAVVLVLGASLMVKTFVSLQSVDTGFDARNLLTLEILLPDSRYPDRERQNLFYRELVERTRALPEVGTAASVYPLPLNHESLASDLRIEGREENSEEKLSADSYWVSEGFFDTMKIPLLRGRAFAAADNAEAAPVAIVNQTLAERYWPERDPVGLRLHFRGDWRTVVGVVGDSVVRDLNERTPAVVYMNQEQSSTRRRFIVARSLATPEAISQPILGVVSAIDPNQQVVNVRSMSTVIVTWLGPWMMGIGGLSLLGVGALLLAAMGLYGVVSYTVSQRTQEFGVRSALGASAKELLQMVVGRSLLLTGAGIAIGLLGAVFATRFLQGLLFGVEPLDLASFAVAPLVLGGVAVVAALVPARRAARTDPMMALRHD